MKDLRAAAPRERKGRCALDRKLKLHAAKADGVSGLAIVFAALGEKDKAFVWLEKDVAERSQRPPLFSVNPVFDDLRDDPRFKDLLHRIELAKID